MALAPAQDAAGRMQTFPDPAHLGHVLFSWTKDREIVAADPLELVVESRAWTRLQSCCLDISLGSGLRLPP